jgi:hypothetical protein
VTGASAAPSGWSHASCRGSESGAKELSRCRAGSAIQSTEYRTWQRQGEQAVGSLSAVEKRARRRGVPVSLPTQPLTLTLAVDFRRGMDAKRG